MDAANQVLFSYLKPLPLPCQSRPTSKPALNDPPRVTMNPTAAVYVTKVPELWVVGVGVPEAPPVFEPLCEDEFCEEEFRPGPSATTPARLMPGK